MSPSLTVFSLPKPFVGLYNTIQRNAIRSWLALGSQIEVILFGDEEGTREAAVEFGIRHVAAVERNEYGSPFLNSVFRRAQEAASRNVVCYVNADIMLFADLLEALSKLGTGRFLMVGQRIDLDVAEDYDFSEPAAAVRHKVEAYQQGTPHPPAGSDYFVFPRGQWMQIPPFIVGVPIWDNWLIYDAVRRGIPVVNASAMTTAVHQNHPVPPRQDGQPRDMGIEAQYNRALAGDLVPGTFTLEDATHVLDSSGIHRVMSISRLRRKIRWGLAAPIVARLRRAYPRPRQCAVPVTRTDV